MDLNIKQQATTCWDRRHDTRHETENDCIILKRAPSKMKITKTLLTMILLFGYEKIITVD